MVAVSRIKIENFKSIRDAELELRGLNVVIGPNGVGKSNLIGAFRLLGRILEGRLQEYVARQGGAARLLHHGPKRSRSLQMRFDFPPNAYSFSLAPDAADQLYFLSESTHFRGRLTTDGGRVLGAGHREALLPASAATGVRVAQHVMRRVHRWIVFHFHDTSDESPAKRMADVDDNRALRADAANLPAFLYLLSQQHPEEFRAIEEYTRRIAPFFAGFDLAPSAQNPSKIKLEWRHKDSDAYFDAAALSDGTLRFICLATLLLQPAFRRPSLILLDEPELGLHPAALTLLMEMLRNCAARTQIIAATQSVTLLDHLQPEEVVVADLVNGATKFRRLEEPKLRDWLDQYGLGELWLKGELGGRPR
jgi:predicted ATPase